MDSSTHVAPLEAFARPPRTNAGPLPQHALERSRRAEHRAGASLLWLIALALLAPQPVTTQAHETDQDTLPLGREFADLRVPLSRMVQGAIVEAVNQTNDAIKGSLRDDGHPTERTAHLQSADRIAGEVWEQLFATFPTNEGLDITLAGAAMRARYPGLVTAYRPEQYLYDDPLLLIDVTKLTRSLFRSATINVDGTLFGTDKIIHFVHLGRIYHSSYLSARRSGLAEADAVAGAVRLSAGSNPFLSENGLLGMVTTGIRSNADLAANYAGFKFYRNLTETVRIGDKVLPPMLVREGPYWTLDRHVRDEPDFFAAFITPHWNEALNPNSYAVLIGGRVRGMLRDRCPDLLAWYRDERGRPRTREQFGRIAQELSTLYGEDYGYQDDGKDTVSIATTCFPAQQPGGPAAVPSAAASVSSHAVESSLPQLTIGESSRGAAVAARPTGPAVDRFGRTPLWWAARDGRVADVEQLLADGADPNAKDLDGETPLHAAARSGQSTVVETLLALGADPDARAFYGMTPLHVAVEASRMDATRELLKAGSDVDARNMFGASPLHQAAAQGNYELAVVLLAYGADPEAADDNATTPSQLAARSGNAPLAKLLLSSATNAKARDTLGSAANDQGRSPGRTPVLPLSTDAGEGRPTDTMTRAAAAGASTGQ